MNIKHIIDPVWVFVHVKRYFRKFVKWLRDSYPFFIKVYKYHAYIANTHGILDKIRLLMHSFYVSYLDKKTILFYPDGPREFHALYKILLFLGYRVTTNPRKKSWLNIKWWLAFDGNPFIPNDFLKSFPIFDKSIADNIQKSLNVGCNDVSKLRVNRIFKEVFGYSISVNPHIYNGECVMKSNWNALHEGKIVECPITELVDGVVYQKLIHNEVGDGLIEDMRVPIFRSTIPFVYLKYRQVQDRFVDRQHTSKKTIIVDCSEVLSKQEMIDIICFAQKFGLDYGEVDVLRNADDNKIYIVDVNNTPSGPPSSISEDSAKDAIMMLAHAFEEEFESLSAM
jgi:hypothetical protein